jgi:copper homeostasis protein
MIVEAVCCSAADCVAAESAGAERIELCIALETGGLTPSLGLFIECQKSVSLPIAVMVRPREGDFVYNDAEIKTMVRDVLLFRHYGAEGVVVGAVDRRGRIEERACSAIVEAAGEISKVMHRVFDTVPEPDSALEQVISLGFTRLLTSGHAPTALEGAGTLRRHVEHGGIDILAGGSIRASNVAELVANSGVSQVHLGPHKVSEGKTPYPGYGTATELDPEAIRAVRSALA